MADDWEELPLPQSPKLSLQIALWLLPFFLNATALPDDELVAFAQNGGWHKIDKLLPPVCDASPRFVGPRDDWGRWIGDLRQHTSDLKVSHRGWGVATWQLIVFLSFQARKPEVATVISEFVEKWTRDEESRRKKGT